MFSSNLFVVEFFSYEEDFSWYSEHVFSSASEAEDFALNMSAEDGFCHSYSVVCLKDALSNLASYMNK